MTAILWYRQDLRLSDHAALAAAIHSGKPVLPVFILDDNAAGAWKTGGAGRWWLHHSLESLASDLQQVGASLIVRRGDTRKILPALARETGATEIHTGGGPEPWARALDREVADILRHDGVELRRHRTRTMFNPDTIRNGQGGAYGVYTPFAKACHAAGGPKPPLAAPDHILFPKTLPDSDTLADWGLLPQQPDWSGGFSETWRPGLAGARQNLDDFLEHGLADYAHARNFPGIASTSMLSPHIVWGEISLPEIWFAAERAADASGKGLETFHKELLWREFSTYLLWHHPTLPEQPLRPNYAAMPWRNAAAELRAWQAGQTGVPIVDAGMRQLWQTGWIHNRVRMIVASFLTKHLLLPWRIGEDWFWDTLVDGDLSANAASWQWVAGSGADAAPYFRVFNPVLQSRKFDPNGAYVRQFVPELAGLSDAAIHAPWEASAPELAAAGVALGRSYPRPIVELGAGRDRALAAWRSLPPSSETPTSDEAISPEKSRAGA